VVRDGPDAAPVGRMHALALWLVLALTLSACASEAPGQQPVELPEAVEVVRAAATWVSFDYAGDGCFDRSILLGAELAAAGSPSNAQFIVALGDSKLRPRQHPGLEWSFHVAPVVFLEGADPRKVLTVRDGELVGSAGSGAYVLDPALYPDEIAVPLETWIDDLTGQDQDAFLLVSDAREALDPPSDEAQAMERAAHVVLPSTLDEMPRFWQFQLSSSCHQLAIDADRLGLGPAALAEVRRAMNTGTVALTHRMLDRGLLLEVEPVLDEPCWDL
jgi:hypothetical protein